VRPALLALLALAAASAPAQAATLRDVARYSGIAVGAAMPSEMRPDHTRPQPPAAARRPRPSEPAYRAVAKALRR
jgi:hypothetical protein